MILSLHNSKKSSNFAADLKKRLYIVSLLCLLCVSYAYAETLILRTGARVKGTIVFQNDEVVVIKSDEGPRFQYPRTDIEQILEKDVEVAETPNAEVSEEPEIDTPKKVSIALELAGGVAINPNDAAGGAFSLDFLVGSHHIADRHLFIGGGLGYHGLFFGADKFNFLPIQVALRIPFVEAKHAPVFGASLGYGVALSKDYLGGIYADIDFGYRFQLNPKTAISVVGFAQFQQATVNTVEIIEEAEFINHTGRNFFTPGIKVTLYF